MIKEVVKRSGKRENFDADKLNRWGKWAANTLGNKVDWSNIVLSAYSTLPEVCTTKALQEALIKCCLDEGGWSYNRMAGRLYASLTYKDLYPDGIPTVKELHSRLQTVGLMIKLNYTEEEYDQVEKWIDHRKDYKSTYCELQSSRKKYSLKNRVDKIEYESQQFIYMRMAMALAENRPVERRMQEVKDWYELFSDKKLSAPTPNYTYLGTKHAGFISCILYRAGDNAKSLAVGDHIAYTSTCLGAGVGSSISTRSLGNSVRNGMIVHNGKLPYYRALEGAVKANQQGSRSGAITVHFHCFDPEIETLLQLKNPMSTEDKKIRGMDYSFGSNRLFAEKVAKNKNIFLFNEYTAPALDKALYSGDADKFDELYHQYEADDSFEKKYVNARDILVEAQNQAHETGRLYFHFIDEMNRHTPFKDTIYSSNLC